MGDAKSPTKCAAQVLPAITAYAKRTHGGRVFTELPPDDRESLIADLIADLHHFADLGGYDWSKISRRAADYHAYELDEYGELLATAQEPDARIHQLAATDARGVVEVFDVDRYRAEHAGAEVATCGACGRSWDDSIATAWTPAPSARCPFEYEGRHHATYGGGGGGGGGSGA